MFYIRVPRRYILFFPLSLVTLEVDARTTARGTSGRTCACAAAGGHLEVLKRARENDCPWDWRTCSKAARGGQLDVLKWARANGCPMEWETCTYAAKRGQQSRKSVSTKTNNDDRDLRSRARHTQPTRGSRAKTRTGHSTSAAMGAQASRGVESRGRKRKRDLDAQA